MERWLPRDRVAGITLASIVAAVLVFAYLGWYRRWISDDGLIYSRIIRNILEGNGPVFNAFERAEANTSTLWPWLIALFGFVTRIDVAHLAVALGIMCSVAGLALGLDATRRLHRLRGSQAPLVPAGVFLILGTYPFWDYESSGLETGLTMLWSGAIWALLVTLAPGGPRKRQAMTAFVFGLGPLVRPDLGLVAVVFMIAAWLVVKPTRRRTLALVGIAVALPVAYEVFRAGYYGTLVPLPALAKSATGAEWGRGLDYVLDFMHPYWLWLPLLLCAGLAGYAIKTQRFDHRTRILIAAPIVAGALLLLYVMRIGGDFMHGRMCLPALFLGLLPGLLVPLRRVTAIVACALAIWALVTGYIRNDGKRHTTSPFVDDERSGYVHFVRQLHPVDARPFVSAQAPAATMVANAMREGRRIMIAESAMVYALDPRVPQSVVYIAGRLGSGGAVAPIDGIAADVLGLANPLGARITMTWPSEPPGHQKLLPWAWLLADFADPAMDHNQRDGSPVVMIAAARHAMTCGELAELLASVREPMTLGRFWDNLTGSVRRTRLVIPSDPIDAEHRFCGTASAVPIVTASSSFEDARWSKWNVIDKRDSVAGESMGFSSDVGKHENHTEWLALQFPARRSVSGVVLHPRNDPELVGVGFPIDFTIQIWDGTRWVDRVVKTDYQPPTSPQTFTWSPADTTDRIRVFATKLQQVGGDGYLLQLAEIEAVP